MTDHELAYWLDDKIPACGDYAKQAALVLTKQADEIERNRAAIDELVWALKAYQQAGFGNSTDFVQQKIAAHMARAAITKHTQPKEQA